MALRDQPYLPLYIQDFMTDEKLAQCSAQTVGVYVRLMCVMHKSDEYGKVLLKQKDKETDQQIENFALKIAKQIAYPLRVISSSLHELIDEKVLIIDGDYLIQKRMVKDNDISVKRSNSGSEGGKVTGKKIAKAKRSAKSKAKPKQNHEIETEDETVIKTDLEKAWDAFLEMRIKLRKPATPRAIELINIELEKLAPGDDEKKIKIINQSIRKGWLDVFPLKSEKPDVYHEQPDKVWE